MPIIFGGAVIPWQLLCTCMYKQRHDRIARIVHWSLLKRFNLSVAYNYWNHIPSDVVESVEVKILWDFNIYTDHYLSA